MDIENNKSFNDIKKNINLLSENLIKFINENKNFKKFNSEENKINNNNNNDKYKNYKERFKLLRENL